MIQLSNITLICVATENVPDARKALIHSCIGIKWGDIKLLTSEPILKPELSIMWNHSEIYIEPFKTIDEWNHFIFYNLHNYINTKFVCLIHPDGHVTNPDSWNPEFLNCDYIGAAFPANTIFDIYGNEVRVGNSVSIRSKRLLELPSKLGLPWIEYNGSFNEDAQICAHYRPYFIGAGMTFAPIELAVQFSQEIPVPEAKGVTPFAFHYWEPPFSAFKMSDTYAEYVNLDSRTDRNEHMIQELQRVGITAERRTGLLPDDLIKTMTEDKWSVIYNRTRGALGCWYSQVAVMEKALSENKHAFVMEDDLIFCDDFWERMRIVEEFLSDHDWDIFWLGGTYHIEPTWHKSENCKHTHPDLQMCSCDLNRDWEPTENPNIVKTYGCWSTYGYIVNKKRIPLLLERLEDNIYRSMGIDWFMILMQPQLNTFAFNPGCIKQMDNQSNIGAGITHFSVFESLGPHWYKQNL